MMRRTPSFFILALGLWIPGCASTAALPDVTRLPELTSMIAGGDHRPAARPLTSIQDDPAPLNASGLPFDHVTELAPLVDDSISDAVPVRAGAGPQVEVGLGVGFLSSGELSFEDVQLPGVPSRRDEDYDTDSGFFYKITADFFPVEAFGVGLFVLQAQSKSSDTIFFNFQTQQNQTLGDVTFLSYGLSLKPRFVLDDAGDFAITPGLAVGFSQVDTDFVDVEGLALNFGLEARMRLNETVAVFVEPGFISQPTGETDGAPQGQGGEKLDVTFSPILYVTAGVTVMF